TDQGISKSAWVDHIRGKITSINRNNISEPERVLVDTAALTKYERLSSQQFYKEVMKKGIYYGPAFQAVKELWRTDQQVIAKITLNDNLVNAYADKQYV